MSEYTPAAADLIRAALNRANKAQGLGDLATQRAELDEAQRIKSDPASRA